MTDTLHDAVEAALREHPQPPDDMPEADVVCTGWVLIAEWMVAGAEDPSSRWVTVRAPEHQSRALGDGLAWFSLRDE